MMMEIAAWWSAGSRCLKDQNSRCRIYASSLLLSSVGFGYPIISRSLRYSPLIFTFLQLLSCGGCGVCSWSGGWVVVQGRGERGDQYLFQGLWRSKFRPLTFFWLRQPRWWFFCLGAWLTACGSWFPIWGSFWFLQGGLLIQVCSLLPSFCGGLALLGPEGMQWSQYQGVGRGHIWPGCPILQRWPQERRDCQCRRLLFLMDQQGCQQSALGLWQKGLSCRETW